MDGEPRDTDRTRRRAERPASAEPRGPGTRARVVQLLHRGAMTVEELADALALSDNAVRFHIAELQREGSVRCVGVERRGRVGKPPAVFELTTVGEALHSRAYAPVLAACISELARRLPHRELRRFLCAVGARVGMESGTTNGDLEQRAAAAVAFLASLGGSVTPSADPDGITIHGEVCPLAVAVSSAPATCAVVEGAIAALTRGPVLQQCHHGVPPQCRFLIRREPPKR